MVDLAVFQPFADKKDNGPTHSWCRARRAVAGSFISSRSASTGPSPTRTLNLNSATPACDNPSCSHCRSKAYMLRVRRHNYPRTMRCI